MQRLNGTYPLRDCCLAAAFVLLLAGAPCRAQKPNEPATTGAKPSAHDGPLTPEKARESFVLEPCLRLELVAAEPQVVSPVAMAFDERGRIYVAEDIGYPVGPGEGKPPAGRIALLEDRDGDGRVDRRTDFATGLTFPNGVLPWKGGVIVTCSPDVLYLRDVDGDGKADERRVLFTGFSTKGSTQLRVSHPTLSIDHWVYLTSGLTGGQVVSPSAPERPPVALARTDFRFRPDGDAWEAADGGAQFGITFDDFGRRFICYNRVQVQHVVISSNVLKRNPHLAFSETVQDCPADRVAEPLKGHGAAARLFPISRNVTTADSHAGTFTAACGVTVFRGTGLPERYRGGVFSCDPTGNLVHFDRLEPNGASFAARRARDNSEFLASPDNWCRPVFVAHGPDGALYVCDMYRKTIEHPDYLPVEIRKHTDFVSGKTMGRIWRVVRDDWSPERFQRLRKVNLDTASIEELCATLSNPDGWWRDTAHRLLLERRDKSAIEPLRALVVDPASSPQAVAQALHLLEFLDAVPDDLLRRMLKYPVAAVRENALVLVAPRLARDPAWAGSVLACADDEDARVRFQTAIALGTPPSGSSATRAEDEHDLEARAAALARIAIRDGSDRWARAAVFSAVSGREQAFLASIRDSSRDRKVLPLDLLNDLGRLLGASRPRPAWPELVREIVASRPGFAPEERAALLTGFAEAVRGQLGTKGTEPVITAALGSTAEKPALEEALRDLIVAMKQTALDGTQPLEARRTAVGLLAFADFDQAGETLLKLVDPEQPSALQAAAVRALGNERDERVDTALLAAARFGKYTPALRDEVLSALLSQSHHLPGVLAALENGSIPPGAIDALRRRQLTQSRDTSIRQRAEKLFGAVSGDRAKVYDAYKGAADEPADPARGRLVFQRECASCHRLDREGFAVGPDLFGIRNQPKASILLHILVPDHEITPGFSAYAVATKDGRVLTGLITSETPTSITLRQPLGKEDTILRSEIDELSASKQSLMPQGLEKNIKRQEFADLLSYLKGELPTAEEKTP